MDVEKRQLSRRDFSMYMGVLDELTGKMVGTLADISTGGFKLECKFAVPLNVNFRLRIDHTDEISNKPHIVFTARARWCRQDQIDHSLYNAGFEIVDMEPSDMAVFVQMFNSYGTGSHSGANDTDYLWT